MGKLRPGFTLSRKGDTQSRHYYVPLMPVTKSSSKPSDVFPYSSARYSVQPRPPRACRETSPYLEQMFV
jgi:hypothetical protein